MKVSVLVPIFKTNRDYLRAAIQSVLDQTFKDFELLLLDDCPDNPRADVVREFADPRIRYERNERNLGITSSRNRLVDLAKGEYLAIFDHDDICEPTRLEKEVTYLDAHPEIGVVSGFMKTFGDREILYRQPTEDADIKLALMQYCAVPHSAAMIRKSVLEDSGVRYDARFSPAEDHGLWSQLAAHTRFHNIPEVLLRYRLHAGNTTKVQADLMRAGLARVRAWNEVHNPELWSEYLARATCQRRVRLFGIPVARLVTRGDETRLSVFGIPVLSIRTWRKLKGDA